jgi:hypothetical protein
LGNVGTAPEIEKKWAISGRSIGRADAYNAVNA